MANVDAPFGMRPVRHLNGNPWNGQTVKCYIHASYATALYIGDPVDFQSETDYQDTACKHISIQKATAGDTYYILGVITSFEPLRTDLSKQYHPASTEGWAYVCIDPDVIFWIQDDAGATPTKLFSGQNANISTSTSGSTVTGLSGVELAASAPSANASNQLLILHAADLESNTLGTHTIWEVLINLHRLRATGDGDGALGVTAT